MKEKQIQEVREFNRFYTNIIGLLDQHLLNSQFSLPEARILYELGQHPSCTASMLMAIVNMDRGYMSRILTHFEARKLIVRTKSKEDGRVYFLSLTAKGQKAFQDIDQASYRQIKSILDPLPASTREKLLQHMKEIQAILESTRVTL